MKGFKLYSKAYGIYLTRFDLVEDASGIVMGGPYWFDGSLLVVK